MIQYHLHTTDHNHQYLVYTHQCLLRIKMCKLFSIYIRIMYIPMYACMRIHTCTLLYQVQLRMHIRIYMHANMCVQLLHTYEQICSYILQYCICCDAWFMVNSFKYVCCTYVIIKITLN